MQRGRSRGNLGQHMHILGLGVHVISSNNTVWVGAVRTKNTNATIPFYGIVRSPRYTDAFMMHPSGAAIAAKTETIDIKCTRDARAREASVR
jgi:hypothetical protein